MLYLFTVDLQQMSLRLFGCHETLTTLLGRKSHQ
jgi:hypothetical protein